MSKLNMEFIKEIVMILTGCLGAFGGWELIKYLLNRKQNTRIAEADADYSEFKVIRETNLFLQEQLKLKEERFAEHIDEHRRTVQDLLNAERRIGELLAERSQKLCEVPKCPMREPFSGY